MPFRLPGFQRNEESSFATGQFSSQCLDERISRGDQIFIRHGVHRHAGKLVFVDPANVFRGGVEQFMHWPIMAGEIYDEGFADVVRSAFVVQEKLYIEEIPWMLTVQRGAEFPTLEVG